jgi:hypothetical protein
VADLRLIATGVTVFKLRPLKQPLVSRSLLVVAASDPEANSTYSA